MKLSPEFLKALKSKHASALVVNGYRENAKITVFLEEKSKFDSLASPLRTNLSDDTFFSVENHRPQNTGTPQPRLHMSIWHSSDVLSPVRTFIKAIKPNSDVRFKMIAYNNCQNVDNVGYVRHNLIGVIDDQEYLLDIYVGPENTASPLSFSILENKHA